MPDYHIGTKGAKALALELGYLGQLTKLNLYGEQCNGCEHKGLAFMLGGAQGDGGVRVGVRV